MSASGVGIDTEAAPTWVDLSPEAARLFQAQNAGQPFAASPAAWRELVTKEHPNGWDGDAEAAYQALLASNPPGPDGLIRTGPRVADTGAFADLVDGLAHAAVFTAIVGGGLAAAGVSFAAPVVEVAAAPVADSVSTILTGAADPFAFTPEIVTTSTYTPGAFTVSQLPGGALSPFVEAGSGSFFGTVYMGAGTGVIGTVETAGGLLQSLLNSPPTPRVPGDPSSPPTDAKVKPGGTLPAVPGLLDRLIGAGTTLAASAIRSAGLASAAKTNAAATQAQIDTAGPLGAGAPSLLVLAAVGAGVYFLAKS